MSNQYNVVFTGELKPGVERESFIQQFSERFQCDQAKAAEVLDAGGQVMMKSGVTQDVAEKFRDVLESMGMSITLTPLTAGATSSPSGTANDSGTDSANPYEAPRSNLSSGHTSGEMSGPVSVPIGHGWGWIRSAFSNHFRANPLAWIIGFIAMMLISLGMQLIPLIGALAVSLLSPVFAAGFMIGAHAQDQGEDFTVGHIFSGFKQATGQLVLVGLFYLIATIVVMIISFSFMGGSMALLGGMGMNDPAAAQAMAQNPMAMVLPSLIMMALFIPLMMAYWFAPSLVALDGISALAAMRMSFVGCLKNMLPFLLYGIAMLLLTVVAAIPVGLGFLILFPVVMASMYTAYRDIYYPEA